MTSLLQENEALKQKLNSKKENVDNERRAQELIRVSASKLKSN